MLLGFMQTPFSIGSCLIEKLLFTVISLKFLELIIGVWVNAIGFSILKLYLTIDMFLP